ncbi:hypothetical protein Taro_027522 [Colocasia esculenta]|uniref:Josephin-like protein n=1 Tax=Colocasia esculenta TaxID=4460 RepID=A0A843VER3_COLES|nr:hypothetical protein [Colocasia esculenta]
MSRSGSRRVLFSPDINEKPTVLLRSGTVGRSAAADRKRVPSSSAYGLCRRAGYLPVRLFRYVGGNVVRALRFMSCRGGSASAKVTPRTFPRRFSPPQESHHAEAIEDCIKFINSTSRRSC